MVIGGAALKKLQGCCSLGTAAAMVAARPLQRD